MIKHLGCSACFGSGGFCIIEANIASVPSGSSQQVEKSSQIFFSSCCILLSTHCMKGSISFIKSSISILPCTLDWAQTGKNTLARQENRQQWSQRLLWKWHPSFWITLTALLYGGGRGRVCFEKEWAAIILNWWSTSFSWLMEMRPSAKETMQRAAEQSVLEFLIVPSLSKLPCDIPASAILRPVSLGYFF